MRRFSGYLVILLLALFVRFSFAHPPIADSVLHPKTPAEAWNILWLAMENTEQLLKEHRLGEIADQISLCNPALRVLAVGSGIDASAHLAEKTVRATLTVTSIAQAAQAGDEKTTIEAFANLRKALEEISTSFDPAITKADIFFCPMHPECLSTDSRVHCPKCGMSLARRRIPYSFIYVPPGAPSLRLSTVAPVHLVAGQPSTVTLHLAQQDGTPVAAAELLVVHTQPIHLLIIDPALNDYHHEHPAPGPNPGDYTFTFTPATGASYRVFADVVPAASGMQEYPRIDLPGENQVTASFPLVDQFEALAGGFHFQLTSDQRGPLVAGKTCHLRVSVLDAEQHPVRGLEPVMNAFAHLVGFYSDEATVVHIHPVGPEIQNPAVRGGPELDFLFYPPKAGFLRLFCQVQIAGKMIFAPFDLHVQ